MTTGYQARRAQGARAKAAGSHFEAAIATHLTLAAQTGWVAQWAKNEPLFRCIGKRFIPVAPGVADYSGILKGGLAWTAEAKSTTAQRYYRNHLPPAQARHLDAAAQAGALSLLLLEFRCEPHLHRFAIEWRDVPWRSRRSAKSVGMEDLEAFTFGRPHFLVRFLKKCFGCGLIWKISTENCTCGTELKQ